MIDDMRTEWRCTENVHYKRTFALSEQPILIQVQSPSTTYISHLYSTIVNIYVKVIQLKLHFVAAQAVFPEPPNALKLYTFWKSS